MNLHEKFVSLSSSQYGVRFVKGLFSDRSSEHMVAPDSPLPAGGCYHARGHEAWYLVARKGEHSGSWWQMVHAGVGVDTLGRGVCWVMCVHCDTFPIQRMRDNIIGMAWSKILNRRHLQINFCAPAPQPEIIFKVKDNRWQLILLKFQLIFTLLFDLFYFTFCFYTLMLFCIIKFIDECFDWL